MQHTVLGSRRFSNRRWGRRWRRWSGNRLVGGRFCLDLIQHTVPLRLELAIHRPRFPIEVLGLGVRPDGFLSEKSFPNLEGRLAVVQRLSRPLPEVSPVLPGKITQPHRAALPPPNAFRTLPYAGEEFLQGGGEHWQIPGLVVEALRRQRLAGRGLPGGLMQWWLRLGTCERPSPSPPWWLPGIQIKRRRADTPECRRDLPGRDPLRWPQPRGGRSTWPAEASPPESTRCDWPLQTRPGLRLCPQPPPARRRRRRSSTETPQTGPGQWRRRPVLSHILDAQVWAGICGRRSSLL